MMKKKGRRDANEPEIIQALEAIGATVEQLNRPVDLLVGFRGRNYLLEVKAPRGTLTGDQIDFIADWRGDEVVTVTTPEEAISAIAA